MSEFKSQIKVIEEINEHTNANSLSLCKVNDLGFQIVIQTASYSVGDKVVYFPVDSVLHPDTIQTLGMEGRLSGNRKNRVKTVKLRGEISQGMIAPAKVFHIEYLPINEDITELLWVNKYTVPEIFTPSAKLNPLPDGLSKYDIEGRDNRLDHYELLISKPYIVTEKLEGTNFSACINEDGELFVNSRNHTLIEHVEKENTYWKVARDQGILDTLKLLRMKHHTEETPFHMVIYGELIGPGIQKNIYGLDKCEVRYFDIKVNHKFIDYPVFKRMINLFPGNMVPELGQGLDSHGYSVLNPNVLREGIVIKPLVEQTVPRLGRLILKKRDEEYLIKTGN